MKTKKSINLEFVLAEAALAAGSMIRDRAFNYGTISWKKKDDPVTALDREGEQIIKRVIGQYYNANFIGEEYGAEDNGSELTFFIDPIDGTKSFIKRDFNSAVSIGVEEGGQLVGGVVYDFMRDIMYIGSYGSTSVVHAGVTMPFSGEKKLSKVHLSLDGARGLLSAFVESDELSLSKRNGSLALAMAQLAAGNYEGLIQIPEKGKGSVWDVAAGCYLLNCGRFWIRDGCGQEFDYRATPGKGIIAIHEDVLHLVRPMIEKTFERMVVGDGGGRYGN